METKLAMAAWAGMALTQEIKMLRIAPKKKKAHRETRVGVPRMQQEKKQQAGEAGQEKEEGEFVLDEAC